MADNPTPPTPPAPPAPAVAPPVAAAAPAPTPAAAAPAPPAEPPAPPAAKPSAVAPTSTTPTVEGQFEIMGTRGGSFAVYGQNLGPKGTLTVAGRVVTPTAWSTDDKGRTSIKGILPDDIGNGPVVIESSGRKLTGYLGTKPVEPAKKK